MKELYRIYFSNKHTNKYFSIGFLFLFFIGLSTIDLKAQVRATVTVTINVLRAISNDACNGKMDFYAKVHIGNKLKTFPVKEGNLLRDLNWKFAVPVEQEPASVLIEIWDEDDMICGGGDDRVCVGGNSNRVGQTVSTGEFKTYEYSSEGNCTASGTERAYIGYTITVEPTKTGLLSAKNWKKVKFETKTGTSGWEEPVRHVINPELECGKDNFQEFFSNGNYRVNAGLIKCAPSDPQIIAKGKWQFLYNETQLRIAMNFIPKMDYVIEKLDEEEMQLTNFVSDPDGIRYYRTTYRH